MSPKKKFNTFHEFILKDEKVVLKVLLLSSMWGGNIVFSLITFGALYSENYILGTILGIVSVAGWYKLIQFYRLGGHKAMPAKSAEEFVWRTKNGKRIDK